ncbi:MAG: DNA-directed RNA polymerase subunit omega [Candidatus Krumholzibacteriota bacterium]|nr:DNA-directed RNA polymerase subunit omega [Candidatus Krumholzibacteriota bacterium]
MPQKETRALEKVLDRIPNRYEAIRVIAKEARRINTIIRLSGEEIEMKPTTIAMNRLIDGKVKFAYADEAEEE